MLSDTEYKKYSELERDFQKWVDSRRGASYRKDEIPSDLTDVGNEIRSKMELYRFYTNPPERLFCYLNSEVSPEVTTFTGDKLGSVTYWNPYECPAFGGFPSKRVAIRVRGINGVHYAGTYYQSSGNYCRLKRTKA